MQNQFPRCIVLKIYFGTFFAPTDPLGIAFFQKPRQKYEAASGVKPLDYCHADIQQVKWALENLCGFKVVIFEDACKSDSTQS